MKSPGRRPRARPDPVPDPFTYVLPDRLLDPAKRMATIWPVKDEVLGWFDDNEIRHTASSYGSSVGGHVITVKFEDPDQAILFKLRWM